MVDEKLGATGNFPLGKLTQSDEGELKMAVTTNKGKVIVAFGKPIAWMGLSPDDARMLAKILNKRADEAETRG